MTRANVTVVRISEGEAEATGPSQNFVVHNQEVATVRGIEGQGVQFATLGAPDEFDSWSLERDRRDERVASSPTAEYVSPEVTGYEDLNDNGTWSSEAEYGYVWTPSRVAVGLGAVSIRPLGVGFALGLDLDRRCTVGLRALSLRPLGLRPQSLVLGAGAAACARRVCARRRGLGRRAWIQYRGDLRSRSRGLVPAGTA